MKIGAFASGLFLLSSSFLILSCKKNSSVMEEADVQAVNERDADYLPKVSDSPGSRPPVPLDAGLDFIDVRGVGDSAWSGLKAKAAPASGMKSALGKFDPSRRILKGDLNFINWESGVGERCNSYFNVDYAFTSSPAAVTEAFEHGFNLFGLANNHSEDCSSGVDPDGQNVAGGVVTARFMKNISQQRQMLWHGVGPAAGLSSPTALTFSLKGRLVKVIFGSIAFQDWDCVDSTCEPRAQALMSAMKNAAGDLRILSLHSQGSGPFARGKTWAERFVREFNGDVVFASGPHTWAGVKVIEKSAGGQGVVFHGLGNFLHNQVAPNPDNMIGRVLLDSKTLKLAQVQVIPVLNNAYDVDVVLAAPTKALPRANLDWTRTQLRAHREVPAAYANIK